MPQQWRNYYCVEWPDCPTVAEYAFQRWDAMRADSRNFADAMSAANAALMTNHGVITAGPTLLKAFDFIEVVEITAKMNVIVKMMGGGRGLSAEQQAACNAMIGRE